MIDDNERNTLSLLILADMGMIDQIESELTENLLENYKSTDILYAFNYHSSKLGDYVWANLVEKVEDLSCSIVDDYKYSEASDKLVVPSLEDSIYFYKGVMSVGCQDIEPQDAVTIAERILETYKEA